MYDIVTDFKRPDSLLIDNYSTMSAATLHEAMGKRGALSSCIKPIWPGTRLYGSALTVQCSPCDNLIVHKAISLAKPGDVLVVSTGEYAEAGIWGEVMTVAAMARGINGLVTDGSVRDTMAIRDRGFSIFSRGTSIKGTTKLTPGKINCPLNLGGIAVNPGDIILGDNDGLVAVPLEEAEKILDAAKLREENERKIMERLMNGETTMELLGLNELFNRLGLKEESKQL